MSDNWQMSPPYDVEGREEIEGFQMSDKNARDAFNDFIDAAPKVIEMSKVENYCVLSSDELEVLMEKNRKLVEAILKGENLE